MATPPDIGDLHKSITAVGSRVTCAPPPMDTDQDWLVLVDEKDFDQFAAFLSDHLWQVGGSLIPNDENYLPAEVRFNSFTLGDANLIVTASKTFHDRFLAASSIAKRFNLLVKADRIALFQAVLYAKSCDAGEPMPDADPDLPF